MSQFPAGYETQFQSQSDDEENLYNVERILAEKGRKYLVQWEGIDPVTGEKWEPDWVPKTDCTDDLIADWKREKARMRKKGRTSLKIIPSVLGPMDAPRPKQSHSVSGKSLSSRTIEGSTSTRSRSPAPLPKTSATSRRKSSFCIELPAPRRNKRRRDSDVKELPISPVKKMKLGGPPSPLPASPFDDDDGGVGEAFPKKRFGPVTYKERKPKVIKSVAFPKLTGPYVRDDKGGKSSRTPINPEPTKHRRETSRKVKDVNTDTETEEEGDSGDEVYQLPAPKHGIDGRTSPLKSKSEPVLKPRTRNTARSDSDKPPRASSLPFERPHPTSAARTRVLPPRTRSAVQREIRRQMFLEPPGPREDFPLWPRVVVKAGKSRRRSGSKSTTSSSANSSRKSAGEISITGPSASPKAEAPILPQTEIMRHVSPNPNPITVTVAAPAPAPISTTSPTGTPAPDIAPAPPQSPIDGPKRSSLAKSTAGSSGRPSSVKSVSFRVDGVDDFDEYQGDYVPPAPEETADMDRIKSSVEPEEEPSPQQLIQPTPVDPKQPRTHSQSQSQSNSEFSKNAHISDSHDGVDEEGKKDEGREWEVKGEVEESKAEAENLELVPQEPDEEGDEEEDGSEEDSVDDQPKKQEEESDELKEEGSSAPSSPSLGDNDLPPARDISIRSPSRQPSPFLDIQQHGPLDSLGNAGDGDEVHNVEPLLDVEESYEVTDGDASMAHATEVDMLLSSNASEDVLQDDQEMEHRKEEEDEEEEEEEDEEEDSMATFGDSTLDPLNMTTDDVSQEYREDQPMDNTQTLTDSSSGRMPAPYSRTAIDHPTTREVISILLPGILDTSSQSQSQSRSLPTGTPDPGSIPPTLPSAIVLDALAQPGSQTQTQSQQDNTHSSIEEPASSWSIPQLGQLPPQNDTISNFTPTNPGLKPSPATLSPDRGRILLSNLDVGANEHDQAGTTDPEPPSQINGSQPSQETGPNSTEALSIPTPSRSSELVPVPDMSVEVFKKQTRHSSPESDIGEFSPREFSPSRPNSRLSERTFARPYQQAVAYQSSPSSGDGWNNVLRGGRSSLQNSPSFHHSVDEDAKKQIQEQAARIQALLADLVNLEAAKKAIETEASAFVQSTNRLNEVLQQAREEHAQELKMQADTITDLKSQLEVVRNQYEAAESQREFALDQYTKASTEAKRMSDENRTLEAKVERLERQLNSGLRQWQSGFESNVARHKQEVQILQGQLKLEREIYARSKAPELCRRAAEWYGLKKRVEELEEEAVEAERREALLREREVEIRRRELAIADREQVLEDSVRATQSQHQTTQRLSQDDLQTETMLTDQSAILVSLDGELGEEMVWMCSYRESTGKICGKVFESMGMLLAHVLDAGGHEVEATCECAQAS